MMISQYGRFFHQQEERRDDDALLLGNGLNPTDANSDAEDDLERPEPVHHSPDFTGISKFQISILYVRRVQTANEKSLFSNG